MGAYFDTVYGSFTYKSAQAYENITDVIREEFDWIDDIDFYLDLKEIIYDVHVVYSFCGSVSYSDSETIPLIFEHLLENALEGYYDISCEELDIVEYNSKIAEKNCFVQRKLPPNIETKHLVFPAARKTFLQGDREYQIYSGQVDVDGFQVCFFQGEFFENVKSEFFQAFPRIIFSIHNNLPYIVNSFEINHDALIREQKFTTGRGFIFDVFAIETANLDSSNTLFASTRGASFWQNEVETGLHQIRVGDHGLENCLKIKHSYVLVDKSDVAEAYEQNLEYDEENSWYYNPKETCYTYWQEEKGLMAFSMLKKGQQEAYICTKMEAALSISPTKEKLVHPASEKEPSVDVIPVKKSLWTWLFGKK
jgi:hypothetical protein